MAAKPEPAKCDVRLTKVLMAQYKLFMSNPTENLLAWIDPSDMRVWYFLAVGLDDPYLGGEYLFKLTAPNDFPHKPPSFEFCTQNGVYQPGGPICISVGEFHAEDKPGKDGSHGWRPSLGMAGFATEVVNGMICWECLESGIRIINQPAALKKLYARASRSQNLLQFPNIVKAFEEIIQSMPDALPALNVNNGRLRLAGKPVPPKAKKAAYIEPSGSASQTPTAKQGTQQASPAHQVLPARPSPAKPEKMSHVVLGNQSLLTPGMRPTLSSEPPLVVPVSPTAALQPPAGVHTPVVPLQPAADNPNLPALPMKPRGDNVADISDLLSDLLADEASASVPEEPQVQPKPQETPFTLTNSPPSTDVKLPHTEARLAPMPVPTSPVAPVPAPLAALTPTLTPASAPLATLTPTPAPASAPLAESTPAPAPVLAPLAESTPAPTLVLAPLAEPTPVPAPTPAVLTESTPAPAPTPAVLTESTPAPALATPAPAAPAAATALGPASDDSEELAVVVVKTATGGSEKKDDPDMENLLNDLLKED